MFDLCISIEIKADCRPPEPDPTQPVAFGGRWRVWNFSTHSDRVSCELGTNPTRTDPWTALSKMGTVAQWHYRFGFFHPWKQYIKVGTLTRQCTYKIETLNNHLNFEIQVN